MISESLPPELGQFVVQQIAAGKYHSEEELVVDAVRVLRGLDAQHEEFLTDVRRGMEQLDRGEVHAYDEQGLRNRFEELKDRARRAGNAR